jgi:hypothetical protein
VSRPTTAADRPRCGDPRDDPQPAPAGPPVCSPVVGHRQRCTPRRGSVLLRIVTAQHRPVGAGGSARGGR